jgi:hypothetical protein
MLAKTPNPPAIKQDFVELLRIPPKPKALIEAEAALSTATSAREAGQAAHIEAVRQLRAQVPGQPPTVTLRQVDELGSALSPLFQAEAAAISCRDEGRGKYEQSVSAILTAGMEALREALAVKIDEFDSLLDHGIECHAAAVAAGTSPNNVTVRCRDLRSRVHGIRTLLQQGSR